MCKTNAQTAMTVRKVKRGRIQTVPRSELEQKTRLFQITVTQDTRQSISPSNPKSLGGLVAKPLDFGPVDRGSNLLACTSFRLQ